MQQEQVQTGRSFVLRLEDGDVIHACLEAFARDQGVSRASVTVVGGIDRGSRLVVGPEEGRADTIQPQIIELDNVYEVTGAGTIFPNEQGDPILHLHLAAGRGRDAVTGCARAGVKVWHILEVVVTELLDSQSTRRPDAVTGFELLSVS